METIIIPTSKGLQFCYTGNIIRIQGMSNYCKIYFADNTHPLTVAKVLHWFEEHLPAADFWRVHKTHLVNSRYVQSVHTLPKPYLQMNNGESLSVSRRRIHFFKKTA